MAGKAAKGQAFKDALRPLRRALPKATPAHIAPPPPAPKPAPVAAPVAAAAARLAAKPEAAPAAKPVPAKPVAAPVPAKPIAAAPAKPAAPTPVKPAAAPAADRMARVFEIARRWYHLNYLRARMSLEEYRSAAHVRVQVLDSVRDPIDVALAKRGLSRTIGLRTSHFLMVPSIRLTPSTKYTCLVLRSS